MRRYSITAIEKAIRNLKDLANGERMCVAFLDSTDDPGAFALRENIYTENGEVITAERMVRAATIEDA